MTTILTTGGTSEPATVDNMTQELLLLDTAIQNDEKILLNWEFGIKERTFKKKAFDEIEISHPNALKRVTFLWKDV